MDSWAKYHQAAELILNVHMYTVQWNLPEMAWKGEEF